MNAPDIPDQDKFLAATNGRSRVRVFCKADHSLFVENVLAAVDSAMTGNPYYWEINAGCVGKSYKYAASTARCGVYTLPPVGQATEGAVCVVYDRVRASVSVKCIHHGGERSYLKWFRDSKKGWWFA